MNLDHNALAGTGRTTRMLNHVIDRATAGLPSIIVGRNVQHLCTLRKQVEALLPKDAKERERLGDLTSYSALDLLLRGNHYGHTRFYDYGTHNFKQEVHAGAEVLVDHFAFESHLATVIKYLRAASKIAKQEQWLIDTARMMSVMGRRVYLVSQDADVRELAGQELSEFNVSIEDGTHLCNLNLVELNLVKAHPNAILLVDPSMVEATFRGALNEINRWDAK